MAEEITEPAEKPILIQVFVYSDKVQVCSYHIPGKKIGIMFNGECTEENLGVAVGSVIRKVKGIEEVEITGSLIPVTKTIEEPHQEGHSDK
jgi:hypothetical protein